MNKMLRRYVTMLVIVIVGLSSIQTLAAKGAGEVMAQRDSYTVKMAVMQGPSGFSSIALTRNEGKISNNVSVEMNVYPSPNEVIARLANKEIDVAALPTNVAANLYNKGVPVKLAATVGEGMLKIVGTDRSIREIQDLAGKTIHIPGSGSTPDQMVRLIGTALGYDVQTDMILDYSVAAPAQLTQLLIAGKVATAILPEPFVTMALSSNKQVEVLLDVQYAWSMLTGIENYPMTVLVVSESFAEERPEALQIFLEAVKDSVAWVIENPDEAGAMIEQAGIMKAAMAVPAIPNCNLVFRTVAEGRQALQDYLTNLYWFDSQSIGGAVPDDSFYLGN